MFLNISYSIKYKKDFRKSKNKKIKRKTFGKFKTFPDICVIVRKKDLINTDNLLPFLHQCPSTFIYTIG
jgi:hypothetical protein